MYWKCPQQQTTWLYSLVFVFLPVLLSVIKCTVSTGPVLRSPSHTGHPSLHNLLWGGTMSLHHCITDTMSHLQKRCVTSNIYVCFMSCERIQWWRFSSNTLKVIIKAELTAKNKHLFTATWHHFGCHIFSNLCGEKRDTFFNRILKKNSSTFVDYIYKRVVLNPNTDHQKTFLIHCIHVYILYIV